MIKRPNNHIKESNSKAYVNKIWSEWVVNELENDYGIDLDVTITEKNNVININFPAQLKSTDDITIRNGKISFSIDTEHLLYFFREHRPFIFILYDNQKDIAYWLMIQDYIWDYLNENSPDWRIQKYNTLYIPIENQIENKEKVKKTVIDTQNRIIQENWGYLGVGEGLGLKNTLSDIEKMENFEEIAEQKVTDAKFWLADKWTFKGDISKAIAKIQNVYNQDKRDLTHLKAIINLVSLLRISDEKENQKRVDLCEEGIDLAIELKETTAEAILTISKNKALIFPLINKIHSILYSKLVSSESQFSQIKLSLLAKEHEEITKEIIDLSEEINGAISVLITNEEYYLLVYCLTEVLDIFSSIIPEIKIFETENIFLEDDIEAKVEIAGQLLEISTAFDDKELDLYVKSSVAYLYYLAEIPTALELMQEAVQLAKELGIQPEIERLEILLEQMEVNPEPFKKQDMNDMSCEELQNLIKRSLEMQDYDLDSKDESIEPLLLGLKDVNPEEYLRFCNKIDIVYLSTSPLGESVGLNTLGWKLIHCSEKNVNSQGIDLESLFTSFKKQHCENCEKRLERDPNWKCTVGWIEKRRQSDMIQNILRTLPKL